MIKPAEYSQNPVNYNGKQRIPEFECICVADFKFEVNSPVTDLLLWDMKKLGYIYKKYTSFQAKIFYLT